jgi:hypothetical protein
MDVADVKKIGVALIALGIFGFLVPLKLLPLVGLSIAMLLTGIVLLAVHRFILTKRCPYCDERIDRNTKRCPHCDNMEGL